MDLAFEGSFEMTSYYLDLDTGEVISVSEDARGILETIYESYYDEQAQIVDWQRELVNNADQVEAGLGVTMIAIPSECSSEGYTDMEAFIDTVRNPHLKVCLEREINRRGPFRNFKDVLMDYPSERERWFQFKPERLQSRILEWLEEHDITL